MQKSIYQFIHLCAIHLPIRGPIFEFGAYQVGRSDEENLRGLFPGFPYVGCDMRAGPGVDRVLDLHALALPDETAGCAICLDTLEHVEHPRRAVDEMHRTLRAEGILIVSSVFEFPIHGYPDDYWRFTPAGFASLLKHFRHREIFSFGRSELSPQCVVAVAFKGEPPELDAFQDAADNWSRWNSAVLRKMLEDKEATRE